MLGFEKTIRGGGLLGLVVIGGVVFAESGLLVGVMLPGGDTTLLLAGSFAATGALPLVPLIAVIVVSAILGDYVGYQIGRHTGKRIFRREESFLFHPEHLLRAEKFYEKHGGKTIILARFVPMVRTFAPLVAGVGKMPRKRFITYNIIGAVIWGTGVTMLGYVLASTLGENIEQLDKYLLMAVGVTTVAVFLPAGVQLIKMRASHKKKTKQQRKVQAALKEASEDIEETVNA